MPRTAVRITTEENAKVVNPTARVVEGTDGVLAVGMVFNENNEGTRWWGPEWVVTHVPTGMAVSPDRTGFFHTWQGAEIAAVRFWKSLGPHEQEVFQGKSEKKLKAAFPHGPAKSLLSAADRDRNKNKRGERIPA